MTSRFGSTRAHVIAILNPKPETPVWNFPEQPQARPGTGFGIDVKLKQVMQGLRLFGLNNDNCAAKFSSKWEFPKIGDPSIIP